MDETAQLAAFATGLEFDAIPDDVVARATVQITDTAGVALCAAGQSYGERIRSYVEASMPGDEATVLGGGTVSATGAAFANGAFAHANDYDDTFESIIIHPSTSAVPAALAAAERANVNGAAFLTGYVAGVETIFRIGHATYPSHYTNGWHSTGTIGTFGATAAAASVLGLDERELRRAFGIAASSSSALLRNAGTMTKALHAAHASRCGVEAALLACEGVTADESVLTGDRGYGAAMTPDDGYDPEMITNGLGEEWAVMDLGIKPYPCGRIMHAAMEAMRELKRREGLTVDDVGSIVVSLDDAATDVMTYERPTNEFEALASIEFGLVAILREGTAGVAEFTNEYITDERTRAAMALIERDFQPNLFGDGFGNYGARLIVTTVDGERFEIERRRVPGSPSSPLSEERRYEKFAECTTGVLEPNAVRRAFDSLSRLPEPGALERALVAVAG